MADTLANSLFRRSGDRSIDILVADDDPASRRFLADGLRRLGARVAVCGDGAEALALARDTAFALLLLDCRMPGAGALEVLSSLRRDDRARSQRSRAVASSAEVVPAQRSALLAAGFSDILIKPCNLASLQRLLATLPNPESLLLDDRAALIASGDQATMRALRGLLREELELLRRELAHVDADRNAFAERLHRLRSSCGFCGAAALSAETVALQQELTRQPADIEPSLRRFGRALESTLLALAD